MKLAELLEAKTPSLDTLEDLLAKTKKTLAANPGHPFAERQIAGLEKQIADYWKGREQVMASKHSGEWWDLAKKQYPITKKDDSTWVVTSKMKNWNFDDGKFQWEFAYKAQATEKVMQLVKWVLDSRKRKKHGDMDADVEKWMSDIAGAQ
jgi:hypothetical protein